MIHQLRKIGILVSFILLASSFQVAAQSNNIRGFYLSDINSWIGNSTSEDAILNYAQNNGFNYFALYDLGSFDFNSSTKKNLLAAFIKKAKTQYGVSQFGASGETYSFFLNYIIPYNNSRSISTERFDVLNFEFEFWVSSSVSSLYCSKYLSPNGYSCDTLGAFAFAKKEFRKIDSLCAANNVLSEVYLGWPNKGQMQELAGRADRMLLHAYRTTDSDVYQYSRNRLIDIASLNKSIIVMPIFSSESSFMGPWLQSNPQSKAYQTYSTNYTAETGSWKQHINLQGYQWFTYAHMPKNTSTAVATITANGPTSFCTGGSVTLTANSGSAYLWSPGGQTTRSITVSQSGSYTVRVTNTSGVNATSSATTVNASSTLPTPTISASGATTFCQGSSVTLTASSANSYLWSTGATTSSITVNASGTYTVTALSGTCNATSAATTVTVTAAPATPVISYTGTLQLCPGNTTTLTSTTSNGYLWSNGATTKSITVSSAGTYWVRAYSGGNCFSQSGNLEVSSFSTPTITASGATSFCQGGNVTLTSSLANSYLWSNGATTRSITASNAGTYKITAYSGTCSATSSGTAVSVNAAPAVPVITSSGGSNSCSGNPVTLTSSSGSSYLWSTGATTSSISVSSSGTYWVRAYSGPNCFTQSANKIINLISAPATPVITAGGSTVLSSTNTSVTMTSTSANAYLWNTGATTRSITVSNPGNYKVVVTGTGGCTASSASFAITSSTCTPPAIPSISVSGNLLLPTGQSVTLTSTSGGGYLWSNGANTQSITVSQGGSYSVRVYNGGGCFSTSFPISISSINPRNTESVLYTSPESFTVYPNPARDFVNFSYQAEQSGNMRIILMDLSGREVYNKMLAVSPGENRTEIQVSEFQKGIYFARLLQENAESEIKVIKVIIQ